MAIKTIFVKGRGIGKEAVAAGAILPGSLLEYKSTGKVGVHSVAGGKAPRLFARENELAGMGIADAYAADDTVFFETALPGFEIFGYVAASAAAIVIGDKLVSNGAGGVRKATAMPDVTSSPSEATIEAAIAAGSQDIVGFALQAVDNSANGASIARILFEVA